MKSFFLSYKNIKWLSLPVLGGLGFIGILSCAAIKNSRFSFRFPGFVTAFSYCLVSAMFCPPIYAMGNVGEERILNIIFFTWLLAMAVNVIYWLGWLCRRKANRPAAPRPAALVLACALLLAGFALPVLSGRSYTSLLALSSLRSGEAKAWHDCFEHRLQILNDDSIRDARIEPYPCQPYLLFYCDIADDPEAWENVDMASFYGKDSIKFNTLD